MDLNIDLMMFMQSAVDQATEMLDSSGDPMIDMIMDKSGMADLAREDAAQRQAALDELIANDDTWKPA